jgi:predicted phosphodiesterase
VTAGTFRPSAFDAASCAHGWSRYALADVPELTPAAPTVTAPVAATAQANPGLVPVELISDDHLNPEGLRFARDLAHKTGARAVLDAGDTTSFGVPGEACVVTPLIRSFGVPYVWVRGNHDSPAFEKTMRVTPNVRVLDGGSTTVAGVTVWGIGDPSFTPRRSSTTAEMAANAARLRSTALAAVESNPIPPEVLLVHECQMVASADPVNPGTAGAVPLVLCGHTHRQAQSDLDGTLVLHAGSVGAGGLAAFALGGLRDFDALVLYFDATTHSLVKYYDVSAPGGQPARFVEHLVTNDTDAGSVLQRPSDRRLRP